jgi:hypothetical protein
MNITQSAAYTLTFQRSNMASLFAIALLKWLFSNTCAATRLVWSVKSLL